MKIRRECRFCGKVFYVRPSSIKFGRGKNCSPKCSYEGQKKQVRIECLTCRKEFFTWPSQGKKFCSKECVWKWASKNRRGKNSTVWKGGEIEKSCEVCGKKFLTYPARAWRSRFCSLSCNAIYRNKHQKKKPTSIEIKIEKYLKKLKLNYQSQKVIKEGKTVADFYIPAQRIVIYCDGTYWHSSAKVQRRDATQNLLLTMSGYKVFRFWEKDINKSAKRCVNKVVRFLKKKESYEKRRKGISG